MAPHMPAPIDPEVVLWPGHVDQSEQQLPVVEERVLVVFARRRLLAERNVFPVRRTHDFADEPPELARVHALAAGVVYPEVVDGAAHLVLEALDYRDAGSALRGHVSVQPKRQHPGQPRSACAAKFGA